VRSVNRDQLYRIDEDTLALLCESNYPGNIRALRNLVYELTSYVEEGESISIELVQRVLRRLNSPGHDYIDRPLYRATSATTPVEAIAIKESLGPTIRCSVIMLLLNRQDIS